MEIKTRFRNILSVISNILLVLVIGIWLFKRAPKIYEAYQLENKVAPIFNFVDLSLKPVQYPLPGKKTAFVFWATWCAPCKLEIARINKMISDQVVHKEDVIGITYNEDPSIILKTIQERNYEFQTVQDYQTEASNYFEVSGTPTVILLDENRKVKWVTSGISPSLEVRLRGFFGDKIQSPAIPGNSAPSSQ
jgi:thiol-disulfide isomerase/thioredoxin